MPPSRTLDGDETKITRRLEGVVVPREAREVCERPWIMIVAGAANIGQMFRIDGSLLIGRSADAAVHVPEPGVSRAHARLELVADGQAQVVDLGSRNGTFVNGLRVTTQALEDGDRIQIGDRTMLKVSYLDASEEALQQNLYHRAMRDPLTQLANRRAFAESLERELAFARRHRRPLCLIVFDVDHFKRVNDTFGHPAGDDVLRRLGETVPTCVRKEDLVARVGGEEFAILLRDVPLCGAQDCAERIRLTVEAASFEHGGCRLPVTISLGVAALDLAVPTSERLIEEADRRLYAAKRGGRNRVVAADPSSQPEVNDGQRTE